MPNIVCNVRMSEEMRRTFRMATLKNNTTVQDVLFTAVRKYIEENTDVGVEAGNSVNPIETGKLNAGALNTDDGFLPHIPNAATAAAIYEGQEGKKEKVTIDQIMAELNAGN